MKQSNKLFLDILMGAVIPILILNNLSKPLGAPTAYVLAALIPVGWVLIDLFLISRTFNFITSYSGLTALKDTAALAVSVLVFGGSILIGKPILQFFFRQVVSPTTPAHEESLRQIFAEPGVRRGFQIGTLVVVVQSLISALVNFYLNLQIVVSAFGTDSFNSEVAQVNTITRIAFPLMAIVAFSLGLWIVYRAIYQQLPAEEGKSKLESEFWTLVELREQARAE
jgi:hypothetical protein